MSKISTRICVDILLSTKSSCCGKFTGAIAPPTKLKINSKKIIIRLQMAPKCKLQTGKDAGIRPKGCEFKTDGQGQPVRSRRANKTIGGIADTVSVAKQRRDDQTTVAHDPRVHRRIRVTYNGVTRIFPKYLLDTGAGSSLLMTKSEFVQLLPDKGVHASPWDRFVHENTHPVTRISGVVAGATSPAYLANVILEIEIDVGGKNSGQKIWRGGPVLAKVADGKTSLVGMNFLRDHHIIVK